MYSCICQRTLQQTWRDLGGGRGVPARYKAEFCRGLLAVLARGRGPPNPSALAPCAVSVAESTQASSDKDELLHPVQWSVLHSPTVVH